MTRSMMIFVLISCGLLATVALAQKSKAPDYEALAQKLVNQCANVKEEQRVYVVGGVRDIQLLENIAVYVRKLGAFPLISITSDRLVRRMYDDVPAKFDSQIDEIGKLIFKAIDVTISIESGEKPDLLVDVPADRRTARAKADQEIADIAIKREIKSVNLGNNLYPTVARAKEYGISQQQLAQIFWAGVNTDYSKLQATGESLKKLLESAKELQITTPQGTDLKLDVSDRTAHVSDGVISEAHMSEGYAGYNAWLPAGEVYAIPVSESAQGRIVLDRYVYEGKEIKGLVLDFKEGKLTSMTAASGIAPLKSLYDAASGEKGEFAFFDLGINPDVTIPPGSKMVAWMPAGMVTVGIGNNKWAGGENSSEFALALFLTNCTLKLDGKTIVENGKLKM